MENHKYREIFEKLQGDISSGRYKPGGRLPSEAELVRRFGVSRMTVFRAMRELQSLGIVTRRVGSGTYVSATVNPGSYVFGLLIHTRGEICNRIDRILGKVELDPLGLHQCPVLFH